MSALTRFLGVLVVGALIAAGLPAPPAVAKGFDPCAVGSSNYDIPSAENGDITVRVGCKKDWPEFGHMAQPNDLITSLDFHGPDYEKSMEYLFIEIHSIWKEQKVPLGRAIALAGVPKRAPDLKPEYIPEVHGSPHLLNNGQTMVFIFDGDDLVKDDDDDESLTELDKLVLALIEAVVNVVGTAICKSQDWDSEWLGSGLCATVIAAAAKSTTDLIGVAMQGKSMTAEEFFTKFALNLAATSFSGVSAGAFTAWSNRKAAAVMEKAKVMLDMAELQRNAEMRFAFGISSKEIGAHYNFFDENSDTIEGIVRKRDSVPLPPLRVMAIGDSITAGVDTENGDRPGNGYRSTLRDALGSITGGGPVDFVGSQSSGTMTNPQHEGYPGRRIDEIAQYASCSVARERPNLIFLHAGTNDANQNYQIASAPERLKNLITQMLQDSPGAVVVVAELIPTGKPDLQPRLNVINAGLRTVVTELQGAGKSVVLARTHDLAVTDGLQGDAHPNAVGYQKLGTDFSIATMRAAGQQLLRAPAAPPTSGPACGVLDDGTALGEGWRALGVIAPGFGTDIGDTTMAELNGDHRADYLQVAAKGGFRAAYNTVGTPGQPHWVDAGTHAPFSDLTTAPEVDGRNIKFADINGDGRDDAVYLFTSGAAAVRLNKPAANGKIKWESPDYGAAPNFISGSVKPDHVRFADLNGDGRDDYIRMGDDGSADVYFNARRSDGAPDWKERIGYIPGAAEATLANVRFADVDGDRKADYLVVGPKGAVHAYLNRGTANTAKFERHLNWARESGYDRANIRFYDISDDGKADYLVVYGGGSIRAWLNRGGNL